MQLSSNLVLGIALVMMIVALPLISVGTEQDLPVLWWSGLVLIGLGGLAGPVSRYALDEDGGG